MCGVKEDPALAEYYVQNVEKEKALKVLKERINDDEDPEKILRIKDKYYREKVVSGLAPMSALIYKRIMLEDPLPKPKEEPRTCIRCGKIVGKSQMYCPECRDGIKSAKKNEMVLGNGGRFFSKKPSGLGKEW